MRNISLCSRIAFLIALCASPLWAQDKPSFDFKELQGPTTAQLGGFAEIQVPTGYSFVDGKTVRTLMEASGQLVSENVVGSIGPTNADWSVIFYFEDIGYVKDNDKDKLDADKLLKDFKAGTEQANAYRKKHGSPPIYVTGWLLPPRYNSETHNLEWAIKGTCEGEELLNYDTRLLGRKGVMSVKLIVDPKDFQTTFPVFTNLMAGYKFSSGQTYAEYKPGDKVAKYGLGALVLGGAAVGAAKLGLFAALAAFFKKGWKLVVIGLVAIAAAAKKILNKITGNSPD